MTTVSIIILNHNGQHYLERCLPSVLQQDYPDVEPIVVDNGSTDGSVAWLQTHHPRITVIPNEENLGFCIANNQGIRASRGEYVILLNNDTELEAGFVTAMVTAAKSAADVGMVASQILFDHDPSRLDSAGIEVDYTGMAWNRHLGEAVADEPTTPIEVFGPCAAAALYKRTMLDQIGLLDERYFIYYEDVDLAWRGQRAGWRCLYQPAARVRHIHSGTTGQWPTKKAFLLGRNKLRTMMKNYPAAALWRYGLAILVVEMAAVGYGLLLRGQLAPLQGRLIALTEWSTYLADRRRFASQVKRPHPPLAPFKTFSAMWKLHHGVPVNRSSQRNHKITTS